MSYIGGIPPFSGKAARPRRSRWGWFPWAVTAGMSVVVAVNIGMVYAALSSFPGKTGDNEFELSNRYDAVLDRVARDAALGWTFAVQPDASGYPVLTLTDRHGVALHGAVIAATAERPLGATQMHRLAFHETADGHYVADGPLPLPGQWDLELTAQAQGHQVVTTRRIFVR